MEIPQAATQVPSSFRDPSGFVLFNNELKKIQRIIFPVYFQQYSHLMESGLYAELCESNKLISHQLVENSEQRIIINPQEIPFITYPYEWPFHLLKEAALLTLDIAKRALSYGMCLKDASSFNIQLLNGKPIFIDTLSFEFYKENQPWGAYGQFCRHFLAPLLLMKYKSLNFSKALSNYIDGFPLDLVSSMLPMSTHFSPFIKLNVHLHAKNLKRFNNTSVESENVRSLSKSKLIGLLNYMESFIKSLTYLEKKTEWSNYYQITNYSEDAFKEKNEIISQWISLIEAKTIWDVGGNNGHFSRLIAEGKDLVISTDIDPIAVDQNYLINRATNVSSIIPLVIDITNPTPSIGFDNQERDSFSSRIINKEINCIMALALIHHLCISNNCTFSMVLNYFKKMSNYLIIEFISPEDSWVKELLARKRGFEHLFAFYNQQAFEEECLKNFDILNKKQIQNSHRTLYLLKAVNS
ncbi:class I SAM-dependent methyltransferase [Legionella sp. WA2022007384]